MARIRTIKPDFFRHETLFDAETETGLPLRLSFAGLWTQCDREGRFEWRPRNLKTGILPYDDIDFSRVLDALATRGFIVKYEACGNEYGHIPSWKRHQVINNRETDSQIPEPTGNVHVIGASATRAPRVTEDAKGKGREGERKGKEEEERACAPTKDYVFEGEVFRLTAKNLMQWQASFHLVPDMLAEVRVADAYYTAEGETDKKKLFFKISQWLKRIHDSELAKRAKEREGEERMRLLMVKSTPEEDREFYRQGILEDIARQKRLAQEAEEIGNDGTPFLKFAAELERSLH